MFQPSSHLVAAFVRGAALCAGLTVVACAEEEVAPLALQLEGPSEVRIDHLGAVEGPRAILSDGSQPVDLAWSVTPEAVAIVAAKGLEAVGPGTAVVTGAWQGQSVTWTLVVEPAIALHFVEPPGRVDVGDDVELTVQGHLGEDLVETGALTWASSNEAVLTVAGGRATGHAAGVVYVTAESVSGSRATVQLEVADLRTTRE